ncbi:MAG: hypothetical protein IKW47_04490 [Alistipes sp.]|nr:hypothetical protein [Alistipes sp.]
MLRISTILIMTMLIGCQRVADKFVIEGELPEATNSIASFRDDIVLSGGFTITEDIVVVGRITSADSEDNFYGSLVVEDGSGAVEVMIGTSNLTARYPEGLFVALRLMGCYADYSRGVLQVGSKIEDYEYSSIGNLASLERVDEVIVRSLDVEPVKPLRTTISQLDGSMCGRLVEVCGLRLTDSSSIDTLAGESLDRARWQGSSMFKDAKGDSIAVYTRDYARYAEHRIPTDSVNIVGILQWDSYREGEECYILRMRYEADCTLY